MNQLHRPELWREDAQRDAVSIAGDLQGEGPSA
jgi:hypothetical protein